MLMRPTDYGYLRRRKDREDRGAPWEEDPPWVKCTECSGAWRLESVVWWDRGPVCMGCFTLNYVGPKYSVKCPRPVPVLDCSKGAALDYNPPGYLKTVFLLLWRYKILTALATVLALAL